MRALLQRVTYGSVEIDGQLSGEINKGLVVLLGISENDTEKDLQYICKKAPHLRIFEDENEKMNYSLLDIGGEMLIISQFTLFADTRKGRRPGFSSAALPEKAIPLYESFIEEMKKLNITVATGQFGSDMKVTIHNDGPVTLMIDSCDAN